MRLLTLFKAQKNSDRVISVFIGFSVADRAVDLL